MRCQAYCTDGRERNGSGTVGNVKEMVGIRRGKEVGRAQGDSALEMAAGK